MKRWIKKLLGIKTWKSDIEIVRVREYGMQDLYTHLLKKEEIRIKGVSITQVVPNTVGGYTNEYLIAISYDYYEK